MSGNWDRAVQANQVAGNLATQMGHSGKIKPSPTMGEAIGRVSNAKITATEMAEFSLRILMKLAPNEYPPPSAAADGPVSDNIGLVDLLLRHHDGLEASLSVLHGRLAAIDRVIGE